MATKSAPASDFGFQGSAPGCPHASMHPTAAFGASYNPFDPTFLADPHAFFSRARKEAPVCFNPVFNMWVVTGYDEVMKVVEDPVLFASKNKVDPPNDIRPEVLEILATEGYSVVLQLFNSDPPEHDRLRSLIYRAFTQQSTMDLVPHVRQIATEMVDQFAAQGQVELRSAFADPLPLRVILDYVGVPREDQDQVRIWDDWWARLFTSAHAIEEQMEAVRQVVAYQKYYDSLINERRLHPRDDLTSRMASSRVDGHEPLRNVEMIWQFMGLLAAGHATTTDAMTNMLLVILEERGLWSSLCANPQQLSNFIDEGLRYVNPVLGLPRVTTRTVELGGVTIPEGDQVLVSFCSANRDEKMTPNPDAFDPTRENVNKHLAFGRGIHRCVGARMSHIMMAGAFEVLMERFPSLRVQPGYKAEHTMHPFLWGLSRLPVEWNVAGR
ncbi:MAG: cytochrome P450 [Candidatus Angelobacter sp.]